MRERERDRQTGRDRERGEEGGREGGREGESELPCMLRVLSLPRESSKWISALHKITI